jgi:hypothetical protein
MNDIETYSNYKGLKLPEIFQKFAISQLLQWYWWCSFFDTWSGVFFGTVASVKLPPKPSQGLHESDRKVKSICAFHSFSRVKLRNAHGSDWTNEITIDAIDAKYPEPASEMRVDLHQLQWETAQTKMYSNGNERQQTILQGHVCDILRCIQQWDPATSTKFPFPLLYKTPIVPEVSQYQ